MDIRKQYNEAQNEYRQKKALIQKGLTLLVIGITFLSYGISKNLITSTYIGLLVLMPIVLIQYFLTKKKYWYLELTDDMIEIKDEVEIKGKKRLEIKDTEAKASYYMYDLETDLVLAYNLEEYKELKTGDKITHLKLLDTRTGYYIEIGVKHIGGIQGLNNSVLGKYLELSKEDKEIGV